ncbi:MAG: glycosyltransferase family 4 protein [Coriobacteriia bacterium]|nr:glycosyltransferase family 4 protein [Coriobacteriia bacterium]
MKLLYVATVQSHIYYFHLPLIKELNNDGHVVDVACKGDVAFNCQDFDDNVNKLFDLPFERSPFKFNNIRTYFKLKKIINDDNYDIVHCHTPMGGILARLASRKARKKGTKVIYTAHGFHFYKGAPMINWLVYFPVEWICSFMTDVLITINKEDYERANRRLHTNKCIYVYGAGINVDKFSNCKVNVKKKRTELGIPQDAFLIVSVGEINYNKNHKLLVEVISKLSKQDIYCIIAGDGILYKKLNLLIKQNNLQKRVLLLGRRNDIPDLLKISDLYVHTSLREGLPFAVLEALASGITVISSDIRGCRDILDQDHMFDIDDEYELCCLIKKIYKQPYKYHISSDIDIDRFSYCKVNLIIKSLYKITLTK